MYTAPPKSSSLGAPIATSTKHADVSEKTRGNKHREEVRVCGCVKERVYSCKLKAVLALRATLFKVTYYTIKYCACVTLHQR